MKITTAMLLACCVAAFDAGAYCIHNELRDRDVFVEQEQLKDKLREDRILRVSLKPGQKHCCRNLACNPGGRSESTVDLTVTVLGEPSYICAPETVGTRVPITGDGLMRVMHNPRKTKLSPYIVRIRSGEKDLTGPAGVPCLEPKKGRS